MIDSTAYGFDIVRCQTRHLAKFSLGWGFMAKLKNQHEHFNDKNSSLQIYFWTHKYFSKPHLKWALILSTMSSNLTANIGIASSCSFSWNNFCIKIQN